MAIESIQEVRQAVAKASNEIYRADQCIKDMAELCAGKLESAGVSGYTLKKLKRELANYNIHTGRWKD